MTRLPSVILSTAAGALLAAALCAPVAAQTVQLPEPVGYVNDFADVIPDNVEASIRNVVDEVRAKSGGEIVVVTLPTLPGGRSRDEIALEIGRQWRIGAQGETGDRARNTGAIFLVVPRETSEDGSGHLKIELGDNTSTFVTATEAGRIRDMMIPSFEQRDYGGGILVGVVALAEHYAERFGFELTGDYPREQPRPIGDGSGGGMSLGRVIFFILLFMFLSRFIFRGGGCLFPGPRMRGGRRGRRGPVIMPIPFPMGGRRGGFGGFGGGFGGFGGGGGFGGFGGGGGFSGGGAGGSW